MVIEAKEYSLIAGQRRKAREKALQVLFGIECTGHNPEDVLKWHEEESALPEEVAFFIRELVLGVLANKEELDATIQKFAPAWPIKQMSLIDKNILRLGIHEIMLSQVPFKVAISEAVELAKEFGSESSPRFINGVLGSFCAQVSK